ncbi:MAG: response regulator [Xenococcaceae cyanobacterium MO_188.B29]|nr:response regulator [Xenococcaceae cyanobacterium MO_188.B29]
MSSQLDPSILAAITEEARQCFLDEDAPEYLQMMEDGIKKGDRAADFTSLLRAAHSLKGGAGLASLDSLQKLAHKLEDVLVGIQQGKIEEVDFGWNLVEQGVNEVALILSQARTDDTVTANPDLISALEALAGSASAEEVDISTESQDNSLVNDTLTEELETSFAAIEELTPDLPPELIQQFLANFVDESLFLAETLNLSWLVESIERIGSVQVESDLESSLATVTEIIKEIRSHRDRFLLTGENPVPESQTSQQSKQQENQEKEVASTPDLLPKNVLSQLRIPLHKLEGMTNNIEELILTQARLNRQKRLFNQANRRLRSLSRQFEPIRDQVQNLYDRLAVSSTNLSSIPSLNDNNQFLPNTKTSEELGFDSLELDRYTELHTSLQSFQELMLLVQETRTDLDLIERELSEDLDKTQKNLDTLYTNVTESRLVPFSLLAKRFIPQIRNLNQRFDKSVNLIIEGENTPIDQVLLEQLQTPLTHLLNNAFDHGIESKAERRASQKSESAEIILKAKVENNQLVITIEDDGGGINIEKVYQKAVDRGICPLDKSINDFSPEEIIDWIFQPDFSTAAKVSDISGRGMGLDIVRSQIRKLRGNLQVQTKLSQGTTFTLKLPLNLSLMSLFLVQLQNRIIAIPNSSVIETLLYDELSFTDEEKQTVYWQQKTLPVVSLANLLPCPRNPLSLDRSKIGIVIKAASGLLVVLVDAVLQEEKLIVKPFDDTIPVPSYLAGCTVLGTGEVIPVILPQGLEQNATSTDRQTLTTRTQTIRTILIAEDSVATRRMLEKILTAVGYQVIVCRDGKEAIDKLEQDRGVIDLILSDVEMPKVNGFELLQKVRSNNTLKDIPVVMATSRTGDRHRQQAMKLGATDYLGKPIQPQELIAIVEKLVAKAG